MYLSGINIIKVTVSLLKLFPTGKLSSRWCQYRFWFTLGCQSNVIIHCILLMSRYWCQIDQCWCQFQLFFLMSFWHQHFWRWTNWFSMSIFSTLIPHWKKWFARRLRQRWRKPTAYTGEIVENVNRKILY